ncbi:hypothetical protein [Streptomyces sp. enrichment culture]|uniref:hypothetical protein n=1 Tax=Streptomyces sp. enrichment culture TaxID=1795815 RepID=UPI003F54E9BE
MPVAFWQAAAVISLALATLTLAAYGVTRFRARRDPARRRLLRLELPLPVALAALAGVLIGALATGRHPHADLDELKTLMIPVMFGMACRGLIRNHLRDTTATRPATTYAPAVTTLLIGLLVAAGTTYFGS